MQMEQISISLTDQRNVPEQADQSIGHSGHRLDENIQCNADHILAGITHGITGHSCLVSSGPFPMTLQST